MGSFTSNFDAVVEEYTARAADVVDELAYEARDKIRQGLRGGEQGLKNDTMGAMASVYVVRAGKLPLGRRPYTYAMARRAFLEMRLGRKGRFTPQSRNRGSAVGMSGVNRRSSYTREEVEKLVLGDYRPETERFKVKASVASCSKDLAFWEKGWRTKFRTRNGKGRKASRMEKRPQFAPVAFAMRRTAGPRARAIMNRRGKYGSRNFGGRNVKR